MGLSKESENESHILNTAVTIESAPEVAKTQFLEIPWDNCLIFKLSISGSYLDQLHFIDKKQRQREVNKLVQEAEPLSEAGF